MVVRARPVMRPINIVLLAQSLSAKMFKIGEEFAEDYDMKFSSSKSVAMRIGERCKVKCEPLTLCGSQLQFAQSLKYLGFQFVAANKFTCSVDKVKVNFYRVFNAIYS